MDIYECTHYRIAGNFRQGKFSTNSNLLCSVKIQSDLFSSVHDYMKIFSADGRRNSGYNYTTCFIAEISTEIFSLTNNFDS